MAWYKMKEKKTYTIPVPVMQNNRGQQNEKHDTYLWYANAFILVASIPFKPMNNECGAIATEPN